ncbi:MAG: glycosyltransferase family 2 protein [Anaerolineae bacterium]|nr:glycosyltransferase family 2 protein [Anaerolineae bacterium]
MPDLAVIVVTWNVRELALNALNSLYADLDGHGPAQTQVYVVDNASSDETVSAVASAFPQVHLIASDHNLGFGGANNLALRAIGFGSQPSDQLPRAVYLLNPDTLTQPGATCMLFDALMREPCLGLVGARLDYGDGRFQHSSFRFPGLQQLWVEFFPTPGRLYESSFNGRYPRHLYDSAQSFAIDFPLGATMMLRREVIEQTGGFDEGYFMYCEEIDWAWRIHDAGWEVKCVPAARVTHLEGQSTGQVRPQSVINLWRSRLRLYDQHYPAWKAGIARWMIRLGMERRLRALRQDNALPADQRAALLAAYAEVQGMARRRGA